MEVYVFKTNIKDQSMIHTLEPILNQESEISQWTVDTEDCDNVLRIVCDLEKPEEHFISLLHQVGFECEPLV